MTIDCVKGYNHDFRDYREISNDTTTLKIKKCVICDIKRTTIGQ